jgi:hypothetical protein
MMVQRKGIERSPVVHVCPVCQHPQTKIQRRLSGTGNGPIVYVCARANQCIVGVNLSKVDTWVAV